jgi:hypothetical protein
MPQPTNALAAQQQGAQPQQQTDWAWYRPGGAQGTMGGSFGGPQMYSQIQPGPYGPENYPGSIYAPVMPGSAASGFGNFTLEDLQNAQNLARSGMVPGGTTGRILPTGETSAQGAAAPTGGSEQYMNALAALDPTLAGRINQAMGVPEGTDPLNALYTWQQEQGEKAINRAASARGLYNSRASINALADFNRALAAEEAQRIYGRAVDEYGRQYGQQTDLFNLASQLGATRYGKVMDILNLGTGAQGAMSNAALATGQGIASNYLAGGNALAQSALNQGAAQGGFWSGLGGLPQNALASQYYWNQLQPGTTARGGSNPYAAINAQNIWANPYGY